MTRPGVDAREPAGMVNLRGRDRDRITRLADGHGLAVEGPGGVEVLRGQRSGRTSYAGEPRMPPADPTRLRAPQVIDP
jgi:hypothetical protein